MLVLSRSEVEQLLDLDGLVDALAVAHRELTEGRASMPLRVAAFVAEREGLLGVMPAYLPAGGALTTKLVSLFPRNTDRDTHQAVIVAFNPQNGSPLALMDGTYITGARTAAGSALATRLLARPDSKVLAVLGTGVQARFHAQAISRVRAFDEVRVAGRDHTKVERLAADLGARACSSYEEALAGADVVAATTHAAEPVVRREWVGPGTHVNSVGLNPRGQGEIDQATVREALLVVESRAAALAAPPAGAPELAGLGPADVHAELGELVAGTRPGRSGAELTLYKSVGVAVQDAAAAALVLAAAQTRGTGRVVEL